MKILMVCGNGLGSSFACQMTVETVLQELGVSASLDHCDLSSVKGMKADLILSGKNFESQFANLELTTPTIFLNRLEMCIRDRLSAMTAMHGISF